MVERPQPLWNRWRLQEQYLCHGLCQHEHRKGRCQNRKTHILPDPTPNSHPRRGHMDAQDRLWFAEYGANKMAMFDTRTEKFQEWDLPTPYSAPYELSRIKTASLDRRNEQRSNRAHERKNNQSIEYQLPKDTNIRECLSKFDYAGHILDWKQPWRFDC